MVEKCYLILATCFLALVPQIYLVAQGPSTAAAPDKPDHSQEAYVIERWAKKVQFQNDGTLTADSAMRVRVQSDAGVKHFGVLNFPYQQANERHEIDIVRVIKPDGKEVRTPTENFQDLPADVTRDAPFYSDLRETHVAVRGLSVGDTLEYHVKTLVHTPLVPGHFWMAHDFTKSVIVLEEELEVSVPRDRAVKTKFAHLKPTVIEEGDRRIFRWKSSNLGRKTEDESKAESAEPAPPAVQLTTFQSFEEVGRWYDSLQRDRVEPTPEIRAKAAYLTEGAKSDEEKVKALYNYVSLSFRYIGIAFGVGRYQPNAAADVLANQYGDCKDKHTLLAALLKAAGLTAHAALINATRKTDIDVPSPAQFDHVITAVPHGENYVWLDTTAEVAPFGFLLAGLRDKQALVIPEGKSPSLVNVPAAPPSPALSASKWKGSSTTPARSRPRLTGGCVAILR